MKYKFTYILLIAVLACNTPKRIIKNSNLCSFNNKINPEDFILDSSYVNVIKGENLFYDIYKDKTKQKAIMLHNNIYNLYEENKENKENNIVKWLIYNDSLQLIESYFNYTLDNSLDIGVEKFYNKKGNIIKVIDHRQKNKYFVCYKQAYMIVDKWKPKGYVINHMERDYIVKEKDTTYTWNIHIRNLGPPRRKSFLYTINAKNGKKIKKVQTVIGH